MRRIFYIAPLLSIIEQNSAVIREAFTESMPVLEHHSDIIKDKISQEETFDFVGNFHCLKIIVIIWVFKAKTARFCQRYFY